MKRTVFIVAGITLTLILVGIWVYVLFFSPTTETNQEFSNLNLANTETGIILEKKDSIENNSIEEGSLEKLRQLTTRKVAGYQEVKKIDKDFYEVYFVEAGVGHIYSVSLKTGEEIKISKTTIPKTNKAAITPNGEHVLILSTSGSLNETILGHTSSTSDSIDYSQLLGNIVDFISTEDNTFLYTVKTNDSLIVSELFPNKNTSKVIFTVPFREAKIEWGSSADDTHYIYPKPSSKLEGFLYRTQGASLERLPISGYGLMAAGNDNYVVFGELVDEKYITSTYSNETGIDTFGLDILGSKCSFIEKSSPLAVCASSLAAFSNQTPDDWNKGAVSYNDDLWLSDTSTGESSLLELISKDWSIDINNLSVSMTTGAILFSNKNDETLWVYQTEEGDGLGINDSIN